MPIANPAGAGYRCSTISTPYPTSIDPATLPQTQQITVLEEATNQLQASIDLANGPTMRAAYFDLGPSNPPVSC